MKYANSRETIWKFDDRFKFWSIVGQRLNCLAKRLIKCNLSKCANMNELRFAKLNNDENNLPICLNVLNPTFIYRPLSSWVLSSHPKPNGVEDLNSITISQMFAWNVCSGSWVISRKVYWSECHQVPIEVFSVFIFVLFMVTVFEIHDHNPWLLLDLENIWRSQFDIFMVLILGPWREYLLALCHL